jgi:hypothetical protein
MRDEPEDGVVDDPWARPPGAVDAPEPHQRGDWGGEPAPDARGSGPAGPALGVPRTTRGLTSPARRLRPARVAVGAVAFLAAAEALSSAWALWETRSVAGDEPQGGATSLDGLSVSQAAIDRLNAASSVDAVVTIVGLVALVVSAVFVIRWQNVVLRNQRGLGIAQPRYSPVAAGFSWFVPIWSLFGPKRAMNDAWRAAEPADVPGHAVGVWLARGVPALFTAWWAVWLTGQLLGNLAPRVADATLSGQTLLYAGSMIAALLTVVAGVLFVAVMERLTARHDARIAERAAPD